MGRPHHHQRRCFHRQGDRAGGPYEKIGAELVKEVAKKTDDVAGDGTTTATVLAQALVREGLRNVPPRANPSASSAASRRPSRWSRDAAEPAKEVETKEQIAATAGISAGDPTIGELIAEAMDKVGKEGVITVEESNTFGLQLELTEGMRFDKGYISAYFVTDADRQEAVLEDPYILLVSSKVSTVKDLLPLLEKVIQSGKPLLIIAEDVEGEALATLVVNKIRGTFKSVAVKAPGFGDRRKAKPAESPILTVARSSAKRSASSWRPPDARRCWSGPKVVVTKDETMVVEGSATSDAIVGRVKDPRRDRGGGLRLRPREAAGAPGQAGRRRRRHQGRSCDRGGAQGAQAPHRRRGAQRQGCRRRGHRRRRRRRAAAVGLPRSTS